MLQLEKQLTGKIIKKSAILTLLISVLFIMIGLNGFSEVASTRPVEPFVSGGEEYNYEIEINIFLDKNSNGRLDAKEEGLPGWDFQIIEPNGKKTEFVTGANGKVKIGMSSSYRYKEIIVRSILKKGWFSTTDTTQYIRIVNNETANLEFGVVPSLSYLHILVYNDKNWNGIKDTADSGLSGWEIYIVSNEMRITDITNNDGQIFVKIFPDQYDIEIKSKDGWAHSGPNIVSTNIEIGGNYTIFFGEHNVSDLSTISNVTKLESSQVSVESPSDLNKSVSEYSESFSPLTNRSSGNRIFYSSDFSAEGLILIFLLMLIIRVKYKK
jgi:hypothetical protein